MQLVLLYTTILFFLLLVYTFILLYKERVVARQLQEINAVMWHQLTRSQQDFTRDYCMCHLRGIRRPG